MTCSEPGCGGTIEDGYCALCGTAPVASPPPVHQLGSVANGRSGRTTAQPRGGNRQAPPPPVPVPGACGETDCDGTIVDGYCDTCGTAPATVTGPLHSPSASTVSASGRTSSRSVRTRSGSARSAARGRLGAGLVEVPPVPRVDPATAVLADPQVPESDRFCGKCDKPVGRGQAGAPGRTSGFCPHCGTRYSFVPRLRAGDLVGGQYEVAGALA
ncbi:serine/threonine protein kinase, partial [Nocardia salmonicida]